MGGSGDPQPEASQAITQLSLKLKQDQEVQHLILLYVAMILNHHRLCLHQPPLHLPLHLMELFQATQQIGAFQVRVRQSLSQVLFTSFQGTSFWDKWARWMLGVLQAWTETIPAICLTPGLLPLQPGTVTWSWRETVVIQAMALEAAHQLVETLPLSPESLEMLLGLQDALVEDSSTIDPKGFEMVPLGLPILPPEGELVAIQSPLSNPAIQHLPELQVRMTPSAPQAISGAHILSGWLWEMTRLFGPEVGYVGLLLTQKMAQLDPPWQGAIACDGIPLLSHFSGESHSLDQGLRTLVRRFALIRHSRIRWEERRLEQARVNLYADKLWRITNFQVGYALSLDPKYEADRPGYQTTEMASVQFSVAPGVWCDRLLQVYGAAGVRPLVQLSQMAGQLLEINPVKQRFTAQVALFLMTQFWQGGSQDWTIRTLLKAVESPEKIQALSSQPMRREGFCQDWTVMLQDLQALGWQVSGNPLWAWEAARSSAVGWLDEPFSIRLQAQGQAGASRGASGLAPASGRSESPPAAPIAGRRMDQISSRALQQALASCGMSQAKLARSLKLDRSTINRWINGSRSIHPRYRPLLWELLGTELQQASG